MFTQLCSPFFDKKQLYAKPACCGQSKSQCPNECRAIYETGPPNPDSRFQIIAIKFTSPFATIPYVFVAPQLPTGVDGPYTFSTTVRKVTKESALINITRTDADAGWPFGLKLQYYAFTTPYMQSHPYDG
jgi:hypothetical protein